jgi:hypothetical protein
MTEDQWLCCADPQPMLEFLRGRASDRKLRLFACGCCRRIWDLVQRDERWPAAVEVAERFADGLIDKDELWAGSVLSRLKEYLECGAAEDLFAGSAATLVGRWSDGEGRIRDSPDTPVAYDARQALAAAAEAAHAAAYHATFPGCGAMAACYEDAHTGEAAWQRARAREREGQSGLLRDIFGPLPSRPVRLDPGWLTPDVLKLAQAAYHERQLPSGHLDKRRLAVLADALEGAGCDNTDILTHLRGPGPHTRGCWPVDLILGKA